MQGSATVHMAAPADTIWNLIVDVPNIGRYSPETFEAEWLDGATGPALGARFRGHVKRNEIGPGHGMRARPGIRLRGARRRQSGEQLALPAGAVRRRRPGYRRHRIISDELLTYRRPLLLAVRRLPASTTQHS